MLAAHAFTFAEAASTLQIHLAYNAEAREATTESGVTLASRWPTCTNDIYGIVYLLFC
ncbi:hypothetical protein FACS189449_07660 [Alphaproteobacteria bacterium]|nr:hypothetical protein FACS189449_07660 [Alphaproteobacteria bacterium]